jgi:dolichol-phosphate mannosyltransferase
MIRPRLSLVICTLDEAEAIGAVVREARTRLAGAPHEIIVVDDSPGEATADVVRALAATDPAVRLIRRPGARGLASAAMAGWDMARGEVLGLMDGDGQHDPAVVAALLAALQARNADLAVASRYAPRPTGMAKPGTGLAGFRDALSRMGTRLTHLTLGCPLSDPLSGCFLMRADWYAAARPRLSGVGFKVLADIAVAGERRPCTVEVATTLRARLGGDSKLDLRVILELAAQVLETRTRGVVPARFALFAGVGATGLLVHMAVLLAWRTTLGPAFLGSQAAAILVAMSWNFWLNNALTFRDARLKGAAAWRGLLAFSAACAVGAAISEAVGEALNLMGAPWLLAGVSGPVAAAVWNYRTAKGAWRAPEEAQAVEVTPAPATADRVAA